MVPGGDGRWGRAGNGGGGVVVLGSGWGAEVLGCQGRASDQKEAGSVQGGLAKWGEAGCVHHHHNHAGKAVAETVN